MDDRHIRRSGEHYAFGLANLLPFGLAWPRQMETILMKVVTGLANIWGYVDGRAADLLERESDPRQTIELLPDWERNWGLPDPCWSQAKTVDERQLELVLRMTIEGGSSREFFIDVAARLGYTITITEYRPWTVGLDRCGDQRVYGDGSDPMYNEWGQPILDVSGNPVANGELSEWPHYGLGPDTNRYYWQVHVGTSKLIWFRCASGQCGVDPHLRIGLADDLECLLNRWKPAHTQIIFDYSNLETPGEDLTEWPSATNTGVPAGTVLTSWSGNLTTTANGQVIDSLDITSGTIFINHDDVTVRRCRVNTTGFYCIKTSASQRSGIIIHDNELIGAQFGIFGNGFDARRNHIHGTEDGVVCGDGHNILIKDNYIHDPMTGVDIHSDGIVNGNGCNNVLVEHNRVSGAWTSGPMAIRESLSNNNSIINNLFEGGSYSIYCTDSQTNVTIEDNVLGDAVGGFYNFTGLNLAELTISGNITTRGQYLDGEVPPVEGTVAFTPTNAVTGGDSNNNTGFRIAATLSASIPNEFRLVFYSGNANDMDLNAVAFGKRSSGQVATGTLTSVLFGGSSAALPRLAEQRYVVSDWMSRGALTFAPGDVMLVGFSTGTLGGTGLSASNSNATSYFGSTANMTNANPSYTESANNCFALVRIESR